MRLNKQGITCMIDCFLGFIILRILHSVGVALAANFADH